MHTYQLPLWLAMATVFLLTDILWWGLANWRHSSLKDSRIFQTLSYRFYDAWAVLMGVSATNTPTTWNFRFLFLLYVCYCFAMSTVFQAFFTSYLVEPGYGKKFETFDDLLNSSVSYGYNDGIEMIFSPRPTTITAVFLPPGVRTAVILWNALEGLRITINCVL